MGFLYFSLSGPS